MKEENSSEIILTNVYILYKIEKETVAEIHSNIRSSGTIAKPPHKSPESHQQIVGI